MQPSSDLTATDATANNNGAGATTNLTRLQSLNQKSLQMDRAATVQDMFDLAAPAIATSVARLIPHNAAHRRVAATCTTSSSSASTATADAFYAACGPIDIAMPVGATPAGGESKKDDGDDDKPVPAVGNNDDNGNSNLVVVATIGRGKDLPIGSRVEHPRLSGQHADILVDRTTMAVYIRDRSTNGVFINHPLHLTNGTTDDATMVSAAASAACRIVKGALVALRPNDVVDLVNPLAVLNAQVAGCAFIFERLVPSTLTEENTAASAGAATTGGAQPADATAVASATQVRNQETQQQQTQGQQQQQQDEEDLAKLEEELTCPITQMLLHNPCMVLPCLHTFSAHAIARWVGPVGGHRRTCPECRQRITEVRPSHKIRNLVENYLIKLRRGAKENNNNNSAATATTTGAAGEGGNGYYSTEDIKTMDAQNTVPAGGLKLGKPPAGTDDYEDDWSDEEEEEEDDDDDNGYGFGGNGGGFGGGFIPQGLPFQHLPFVGQHQHFGGGGGFGANSSMAPVSCPQCHAPSPVDAFQCPSSITHLRCHMCKGTMPERPLCGIPQRCAVCAKPFCDLYYRAFGGGNSSSANTNNPIGGHSAPPIPNSFHLSMPLNNHNNTGTPTMASTTLPSLCGNADSGHFFRPLEQHTIKQLPGRLFGGNVVEQSILSAFLSSGGNPNVMTSSSIHNPLHVAGGGGGATLAPPVASSGGPPQLDQLSFKAGAAGGHGQPIPVSQVWQECLQMMRFNLWVPDIASTTVAFSSPSSSAPQGAATAGTSPTPSVSGVLAPNSAVCEPCAQVVFSDLLVHYRRAIPQERLPAAVTARPNCWFGVKCRTQFHNTLHAQKFNHSCPQEKRKE